MTWRAISARPYEEIPTKPAAAAAAAADDDVLQTTAPTVGKHARAEALASRGGGGVPGAAEVFTDEFARSEELASRGEVVQVETPRPVLKAPDLISARETKLRYTAFKLCFQFQRAPLYRGGGGGGGAEATDAPAGVNASVRSEALASRGGGGGPKTVEERLDDILNGGAADDAAGGAAADDDEGADGAAMYRVKYILDAAGNARALELLDATDKEKDYVVRVTGSLAVKQEEKTDEEDEEEEGAVHLVDATLEVGEGGYACRVTQHTLNPELMFIELSVIGKSNRPPLENVTMWHTISY